jgi:hypothetical protein
MTLEEMLSETKVVAPIGGNTISVRPRTFVSLTFNMVGQQGAILDGRYRVSGGVVKVSGEFKQRLPRGQYSIVFDNRGSLISSKTVSAELKLLYFR